MSSADLLEDGFPHGTPEGYERGCHGSHCAGIEEFGWSCTYAVQQYRGDFQWRRWIQEGKTPAEIRVLRVGDTHVAPTVRNVDLVTVPTVRMSDSREPIREAPKPRPVPNPAAKVQPVCRWSVHRIAGAWVAVCGDRGAVFSSQAEAFAFAYRQASETDAAARRGLAKLASRGPKAAGLAVEATSKLKPKPVPKAEKPREEREAFITSKIRSLHAAGWSDSRIAPEVGLSQSVVSRRRRNLGLPTLFRSPNQRGKAS